MAVQDDQRETEIRNLLELKPGLGRADVDAFFEDISGGEKIVVPVELKSTTTKSVSTARDVGMEHIKKWRERAWVIGFYDSSGKTLLQVLCLTSVQLEPWIKKTEDCIAPDFLIGSKAAEKLTMLDLLTVCGRKAFYTLEDAKRIHKKQWSQKTYLKEMDFPDGYSLEKMLSILRLRCLYLNQRGSTLNNPHIPAEFLKQFKDVALSVEKTSRKDLLRSARAIFLEQAKRSL